MHILLPSLDLGFPLLLSRFDNLRYHDRHHDEQREKGGRPMGCSPRSADTAQNKKQPN
jgi:hypothetical protein